MMISKGNDILPLFFSSFSRSLKRNKKNSLARVDRTEIDARGFIDHPRIAQLIQQRYDREKQNVKGERDSCLRALFKNAKNEI